MSSPPKEEILGSLRAEIDKVLVPLIQGHERHICLIDPPNHANVGDSAILLGELAFLQARFPRSRISFFDLDSYSERCESLIDRASIILIHGGGNFGDIYPRHQELRLRLLQRFADKRIVQLPQSISFADPAAQARTAEAIARHGDFHLLARDRVSHAFATANFACQTWLSPDMAFWLDLSAKVPTHDVFCLLRSDKEAVADHRAIVEAVRDRADSFEVLDWMDEPNTLTRRIDRRLLWQTHRRPKITWPLMPAMLAVRRRYAQDRVDAGIDLLSRGRLVVTDRLHAHIMCCLLGIPHLVFDSLDGKVSAFFQTWSQAFESASLIAGPDQFHAALDPIRNRHAPSAARGEFRCP